VVEEELPPAVHHEDAAAVRFQRIFDAHYRLVVAYVLRRTRSEMDAHDVVAETFAVVWRRLDVLPEDQAIVPWLYGVARRCLANQRRQDSRRSRLSERLAVCPSVSDEVPGDAKASDDVLAVRAALARLRPADQEILRLVAWEELSHREVAAALGVSPNAVAIRFHRARKRLERILLSEGIVDFQEDPA
jgi:RNA polymerase sigma-70 factor (ECF subfamily)